MEGIKNILPTVTTGINRVNPTGTIGTTGKLTKQEVLQCDVALSQYQDVISNQFKEWYCKVWYQIGADRFAVLASQARADGKHPARLFSYLLKKELNDA